MTKFVRQRAEAKHIVVVVHQNKWMGALPAAGKCARSFAFIGVNIHPALVSQAAPRGFNIFIAQRLHSSDDPIHGLGVGNIEFAVG